MKLSDLKISGDITVWLYWTWNISCTHAKKILIYIEYPLFIIEGLTEKKRYFSARPCIIYIRYSMYMRIFFHK